MWEVLWSFVKLHPEVTAVGAITLVQIAPIKINPWSWIAKLIHKWLFGEIDRKLDAISDKVDKLERQSEEKDALQARTHILRFASEIHDGRHHSQEYFLQMLDEIKIYETYCSTHPKFANGRTEQGCEQIKTTYDKLWIDHKFHGEVAAHVG